jgi:uncharacterized OsmC-like protein
MKLRDLALAGLSACLLVSLAPAAQAERVREIVAYDDVRIDVVSEGRGPSVVLLP